MARSKVDELDLEDDFEAEADEETSAKAKSKKKAEPKGIGARQLAEHLEVDPKTFRAWLRRMVESGQLELEHEAKARYSFGNTVNSALAKRVIKLWNNTSHERGRPKKESDEDE